MTQTRIPTRIPNRIRTLVRNRQGVDKSDISNSPVRVIDFVGGRVYTHTMNIAKSILKSLAKRVIDTEAINAEIERQANLWMGK